MSWHCVRRQVQNYGLNKLWEGLYVPTWLGNKVSGHKAPPTGYSGETFARLRVHVSAAPIAAAG